MSWSENAQTRVNALRKIGGKAAKMVPLGTKMAKAKMVFDVNYVKPLS